MKRIVINILLSILILFSNSGWAVTFHYCQDQLASVSLDYVSALIVEDDDACACATMDDCSGGDEDDNSDDNKKCCDNTSVASSTSDSTSVVKAFELQLQSFVLPTSCIPSSVEEVIILTTATKSSPTSAVRLNAPPLYALYCQRVFYA